MSDISMCAYGVTNKQILDEVKIGKTILRLEKRLAQGRNQRCMGFADRKELGVDFLVQCNGILSPKAAETTLKRAFAAANVRCGRGEENFAVPNHILVSGLLELVRTGRVSDYKPYKKMRQLGQGKLATALKEIPRIGDRNIMMSPCLANLGVVKGVDRYLGWILIRSEVQLSRLQYHSRDPRGSYGYWNLPPARDDYLYLLRSVRGLGCPEECRLANGQEVSAATLDVEEYFIVDDKEQELVKLERDDRHMWHRGIHPLL